MKDEDKEFFFVLIYAMVGLLLVFILSVPVKAAEADLTWTAPTTNSDGSPLTDLAGFRVYQRDYTGTYDNANPIAELPPTATSHKVTGLVEGHYVFKVTAFDTKGNESYGSNEDGKEIKIAPGDPLNLKVQ